MDLAKVLAVGLKAIAEQLADILGTLKTIRVSIDQLNASVQDIGEMLVEEDEGGDDGFIEDDEG